MRPPSIAPQQTDVSSGFCRGGVQTQRKRQRDPDRHAVRRAKTGQHAHDHAWKTAKRRQQRVLPGHRDGKAVGKVRQGFNVQNSSETPGVARKI